MIYRKYESVSGDTHYVPVDIINPADEVLVDTHDPNSRGFGGRTFNFVLEDYTVENVKGPWHSSPSYEVCKVTELHLTRVILIENPQSIPYTDWSDYPDQESVEFQTKITGDVIYREREWVLGDYMRGDRMAQQLADHRNTRIYVRVEGQGGSHSHVAVPGKKLHPRAERRENRSDYRASAAQSVAIEE